MEFSKKYTLIEELGKGHSGKFGRTFSGQSNATGEKVMLKFVSLKNNPLGESRIRNEGLFHFECAGLPQLIEQFESETEYILVRKYEEGISLVEYWKKLKKNERLPFIVDFFEKLSPLFKVLQDHGVVHCDIKPSNLLIHPTTQGFEVSLIDFGLAIKTANPEHRKLLFPLGFAAPELLLNELQLVDQRTDIFALGITLWHLFTGELPLIHPNPSIYTNLQLTHPLPDHSKLPKGLFEILKKMTNKHVFRTAPNLMSDQERITSLKNGMSKRYSDLDEILTDLKALSVPKRWFRF